MCRWPALFLSCVIIGFGASATKSRHPNHTFPPAIAASYDATSKTKDAPLFHSYYGRAFKVVANSVDGKSYLLIQNDSRLAGETKYCTSRIKSFDIPLYNYSVNVKDVPISFFELLGFLGSLKAVTSLHLTSACILKSVQNRLLNVSSAEDREQLAQFAAVFVGDKMQSQSCNFVSFTPRAEHTPLQRAEWIKYVGNFANLDARAFQVYDVIRKNYLCLVNSSRSKSTSFIPVVVWICYNNGTWSFTKDVYKFTYVEDAGGRNMVNSQDKFDYDMSIPQDVDDLHAILSTVDVVIDETFITDPPAYNSSTFLRNMNVDDPSFLIFVSNKSLWRYDKRVHNITDIDWNDGAVSQPQLVLADIIEALFPTGNYTTTYFRNLVKEEKIINITSEMCTRDGFQPLDPTIIPCT